ncbi:MAG: VapC toxin family PIN domain ribonuclease [Alkalinema sp. CACIAM 70d]|nr:MAG: VapC toxin family PIN domain ribonuclease [Alkalinema sp. CACIAM 70d]
MRYLIDTNVCVVYLNGRSPEVCNRLNSTPLSEILVCSVVKAELFYGAMRSNDPTRTLARQQEFLASFISLPFDDEAALICGCIRGQLASLGTPIGVCDLQIASIALSNDLILVTHNTQEFSRVEGLQIEDWQMAQ